MTDRLRIASAQLNPVMGDLAGNAEKIRAARAKAAEADADLVVCPELCVVGYPPEDLVMKAAFVADAMAVARALAADTADGGPALVIGCPWRAEGEVGEAGAGGGKPYNAALLLDGGEVMAARYKRELPNYGVFDEKRVFEPGPLPAPVDWRGVRLGLPVCEDIWRGDVPRHLIDQGRAELLICINGSPWRRGIAQERLAAFRAWRRRDETGSSEDPPIVFVNQVGGQDELVFDGASCVYGTAGEPRRRLASFREDFAVTEWARDGEGGSGGCARLVDVAGAPCADELDDLEAEYRAAVTAVGDYVDKNGFSGVVLGLSGGIDSALAAVIAADALGPERVWCVALPSRYSSHESLEDAEQLAVTLGCRFDVIAIETAFATLDDTLKPFFEGREPDITEENLQSRVRGVILMALSNKFGPMVLTTGNKSEMAVGYATLYGDMNGGYNALKDLYKTEVYELSRWRNAQHGPGLKGPAGAVIPERVLEKPPSAELRPGQTDQDSLPPYDVLDDILRGLVDREEEIEAVIARGHDAATVERVQKLLYLAEYKRRQSAPGAKIGGKNFGRDRRYPITNRYRDHAD